jgi:TonB family protein
VIHPRPGGPTTTPASCLTKAAVHRVLTGLRSRARFCYERELQRNPNLAGKVTTRFVIDGAGRVTDAQVVESSLGVGSTQVEACLVNVLRRQPFPKCDGGGVAEVTYPWIFKSTGR